LSPCAVRAAGSCWCAAAIAASGSCPADVWTSARAPAIDAAVRETVEEAGLAVRTTGLLGLYTHPGQVVCGVDSAVRQQFAVVFRAVPVGPAVASCDGLETDAVAWVTRQDLVPLDIEPATRIRIDHALARAGAPQLL
jgi:8-oxo-dGTP diphosphatase